MLGSGNPCAVVDANRQNLTALCLIGLCVGFVVSNRLGARLLDFADIVHVVEDRFHYPLAFPAKLWRRRHEPMLKVSMPLNYVLDGHFEAVARNAMQSPEIDFLEQLPVTLNP